MKTTLITTWERVRVSYWFIPSLMTLFSIGLSYVTTAIDRDLEIERPTEWNFIYTGGAEGARQLFATVAGSMITVAGVVFSLTILTLTLAAQQLGSRLLYNFMRDTGNQVVLGTFVSTFVYCLLALRTVRGDEEHLFVPHASVTVTVLLALASVGVLIYFIHHVAASINPANIISAVGGDLDRAVDSLFPDVLRDEAAESEAAERPPEADFDRANYRFIMPVHSTGDGYVQYLNGEVLLSLAEKKCWLIQAKKRPGSMVLEEEELAVVCSREEPSDDELASVRHAFAIGSERTSSQDLIFPINQLVQVAQRALSPGINDPHTAMLCVDRLAMSLVRLARRDDPSACLKSGDGAGCLCTRPYGFSDAVEASIEPIREYALGSVEVTNRLLRMLTLISRVAQRDDQREVLLRQVQAYRECIEAKRAVCPSDFQRQLEELNRLERELEWGDGGEVVVGEGG